MDAGEPSHFLLRVSHVFQNGLYARLAKFRRIRLSRIRQQAVAAQPLLLGLLLKAFHIAA